MLPWVAASSTAPAQTLAAVDTASLASARLLPLGESNPRENTLAGVTQPDRSLETTGLSRGANARGLGTSSAHRSSASGGDELEQDGAEPSIADLLTRTIPFDRAAFERAIDAFLCQYDELDSVALVVAVPDTGCALYVGHREHIRGA